MTTRTIEDDVLDEDVACEVWVDVPGYSGYRVSTEGRILSLKQPPRPPRFLKPCLTRKGYLRVTLSRGPVARSVLVHAVVLAAFVGPRPIIEGKPADSRHLDGNPSNNRLSNLSYGTHSENMQDAVRHGTLKLFQPQTHCKRGHEYPDDRHICNICKRRPRKPKAVPTQCRNGHPINDSNAIERQNGKWVTRDCRPCNTERKRRYRSVARETPVALEQRDRRRDRRKR